MLAQLVPLFGALLPTPNSNHSIDGSKPFLLPPPTDFNYNVHDQTQIRAHHYLDQFAGPKSVVILPVSP